MSRVFPSRCLLAIPLLLFVSHQAEALDCGSLEALELPDVRITEVAAKDAGDGAKVAHCQADGVIGDEIGFVFVAPDPAQWNGKLYMGGVGGFAGGYNVNGLYGALNKGYAAVMTDTGHKAPGIRAGWAENHVERQVNYGYLGVHRTAATAKAIVREFYASAPKYSYFGGCSNGGRQAMMEAQRYPEDFDGIVAGAPAHHFTGILGGFTYNMQRVFPDPDDMRHPVITPDNRKLLQSAILEQCDRDDGAADNILGDPRMCKFDLSRLPVCPGGEAAAHCLTIAQREAIAAIYDGPRNQDGQIFPGFPYGGEDERGGWDAWITGPSPQMLEAYNEPSAQFGFATQGFKYLALDDPEWDYSSYDFTHFSKDVERLGSFANAVDTDLSGLKKAGGKLIIWHGFADPALTALASIDYFETASRKDPEANDYLRLYMLPGVLHCSGGAGADQVDWLSAMEGWVERGEAPGELQAARVREGRTTMTRPVCRYPSRAVYSGSGDVSSAANFTCKAP